jgi:hypothetical protein
MNRLSVMESHPEKLCSSETLVPKLQDTCMATRNSIRSSGSNNAVHLLFHIRRFINFLSLVTDIKEGNLCNPLQVHFIHFVSH